MSTILYRKASGIRLASAPERAAESVDSQRKTGSGNKQATGKAKKTAKKASKKAASNTASNTVRATKKNAAARAPTKTGARSPAKKK